MSSNEPRILSESEIEDLTDKAAGKAVKTMLITLGIDVNNPLQVQADMKFSRRLRETCEGIGSKIVYTVVGIFVLAMAALIGKSIWST